MGEDVFIDTWGWLALGHRKNAHHQQIKTFYQTLQARGALLYTSDYVIDTSMVIMEERGIRQIITEDEHFHHVGMGFQKVPQELKG